jgi:outer membrane biosynthesis protein TonB
VKEETRSDLRTMAFAAGCSVLLHLLLLWLAPPHFTPMHLVLTAPLEVQRSQVTVPDSRLAPSMRPIPIETNAQANRETPVNPTPFVAARSQRAAQPTPEKTPTKSALPASQGEDASAMRVAQGKPRSQEEAAQTPTEGQPGTASAVAGSLPKVGQVPRPSDATTAAPDPDRPRARVSPAGTTGFLLRNNVGVNRVGKVAVDARFSNYGDYAQRMMEAIQSTWWDLLFRARMEHYQPGVVVVRFKLHRDGTISDLAVVESGVGTMPTFACKDAISACAPFDPWRPDMVAQFGEVDVVTIRFIYH